MKNNAIKKIFSSFLIGLMLIINGFCVFQFVFSGVSVVEEAQAATIEAAPQPANACGRIKDEGNDHSNHLMMSEAGEATSHFSCCVDGSHRNVLDAVNFAEFFHQVAPVTLIASEQLSLDLEASPIVGQSLPAPNLSIVKTTVLRR